MASWYVRQAFQREPDFSANGVVYKQSELLACAESPEEQEKHPRCDCNSLMRPRRCRQWVLSTKPTKH